MSNISSCATFLWVRMAKKPLSFSLTPETCISHQHTFVISSNLLWKQITGFCHGCTTHCRVPMYIMAWLKKTLIVVCKLLLQCGNHQWKPPFPFKSVGEKEQELLWICQKHSSWSGACWDAKSDMWWKIWDCFKICHFQKLNRLLLFLTLFDVETKDI